MLLTLKKSRKKINEKNLSKFLLTNNIPDPDLLIRTGNTQRLSNFYYAISLFRNLF